MAARSSALSCRRVLSRCIALLEQYGYLILMLLIYMGVFSIIIRPFYIGLIYLLTA